MLTGSEIVRLLKDVIYVDASGQQWDLVYVYTPGHAPPYLQVQFNDPFGGGRQHGRKWQLSVYMTRSEVVSTAWKAVIAAEEHEARERFRYKGARIFGPHFDVDVLAGMAKRMANLDVREDA